MIQALKKEGRTMKTGTIRSLMLLTGCLLLGPQAVRAQFSIAQVVPAILNTDTPDEDGDFPAYIEIRNPEFGVLSGHYLTDDSNPHKWQVPNGFILSPTTQSSIIIFASGKDRRPDGPDGELHTNFTFPCTVPFCDLYASAAGLVDTFTDLTDHCACQGLNLLGETSIARTLIPDGDIGSAWVQVDYPDELSWIRGPLGVGYDSPQSPFCNGLVLYHTMDQAHITGTTLLDQSGPTLHDGTIVKAPAKTAGVVAEALGFRASVGDLVQVDHHVELNIPATGGFSAAIWINPLKLPGPAETVVAKGGANVNDPGWRILRTPDVTRVRVTSAEGVHEVALPLAPRNQWTHIALVVDRTANTLTGYFNGVRGDPVGLSTFQPNNFSSNKDLFEATDTANNTYDGLLDEFGIWARALTASEVSDLVLAGQNGTSLKDPSLAGGAAGGPATLYGPCIGTDVLNQMKGVNASAYIRVPFNLSGFPGTVTALRLHIAYDDGFKLYLNGGLVATRNAPTPGTWNSSTSNREDTLALTEEVINLTSFAGLLRAGKNVLAFHGFNSDINAERFLIKPKELCLEQRPSGGGGQDCVKTTNDTDFWLTFPENFEEESDNPLELELCITGPRNASGVVEVPGLGFVTGFTIPASNAVTISLPKEAELEGSDAIENKGIHVMANQPVGVVGLTHMDYTTDTFLALPTRCLGTEYLLLSMKNLHNNVPLLQGSQMGLVAPSDDTLLTITPRQNIGSHAANVAYQVLLQRGETYQLRHEGGAGSDISGTEILSDKPVAVFGSHRCANIADIASFFCDTIVEHLLPVPAWGTSYHVAPLRTRDGDLIKVIASTDSTDIFVDGAIQATINRGETFEFVLGGTNSPPIGARVHAQFPILTTQLSQSSNADGVIDADPFMINIPPDPSFMKFHTICAPPTSGFAGNYINVVAPSSAILSDIRVNGTFLLSLPGAETGTFPLSSFLLARVPLPGAPNDVYIITAGRGPFGLTVYGFDEFDSYGHSGAMRSTDGGPPLIVCPNDLTVACDAPGPNCTADTPDIIAMSQFYDDCTPAEQLSVIQIPAAGTPLTVGTYSIIIRATDGDQNTAECMTTLVVKETWEESNFGPTAANDPALEATVWGFFADPDEDGLVNGYEKMLNSNPNDGMDPGSPFQTELVTEEGSTFLKISFVQPILSWGDSMLPEGSSGLLRDDWSPGLDLFKPLPYQTLKLPGGIYQRVSYKAQESGGTAALQAYFVRLGLYPEEEASE